MKRHRLRLQGSILNTLRSFLAAVLRGWHFHLSALTLHHAAAGAFFDRHLSVRSHARHRRCRTGHQQQQNRSELAQRLHLIGEYPEFRIATTGTGARPRAHLQAEPADDRQFGSRTDRDNPATAGLEFIRMSMNAKPPLRDSRLGNVLCPVGIN